MAIRTWVLVCDGGRSQVFAGVGRIHALTPVEDSVRTNDASDMRNSRGGERSTGHASVGQGRYSVEEHVDPRRRNEAQFLAEQLAWLADEEAAFDRLVIIAPPRALGDLRKAMPPVLARKLAGEVDADLTKSPVADVVRRVSDVLGA